jgi:hypothetical protein
MLTLEQAKGLLGELSKKVLEDEYYVKLKATPREAQTDLEIFHRNKRFTSSNSLC